MLSHYSTKTFLRPSSIEITQLCLWLNVLQSGFLWFGNAHVVAMKCCLSCVRFAAAWVRNDSLSQCGVFFPGQIQPESPRGQWTWRSLWARASCYPVRWPVTPSLTCLSPGPSTDSSSPSETVTLSQWAGWVTAVILLENVRNDGWHLFPSCFTSSLPLD